MLARIMVLAVAAALSAGAARAQRERLTEWEFARFGPMPNGTERAEPPGIEKTGDAVDHWRSVRVPHDWGIEGPFRQDLPGRTGRLPWTGVGWYQTELRLPAEAAGQRVYVDFDGAMSDARVYVNGRLVGRRPYGYSSFRVDLTPHVRFGGANRLAVRLENLPDSSRWYPGAGLYRNVWLVTKPDVHIAHWGVGITTERLAADDAVLAIETRVVNHGDRPRDVTLRHRVVGSEEVGLPVTVGAGSETTARLRLPISRPRRWDIDHPHLYTVETIVEADGRALDRHVTRYGLRTAEFRADRGFLLNGRVVELQGVCMHHDLGPLGTAVNRRAMRRQIEILQRMGCNAIRTSHNPAAPEFLDLCDEMGMLVQEEAFDCWSNGKVPNDYARHFAQWHKRDMQDMVRRDRNRPSIVMWSTGNEVGMWDRHDLSRHLVDLVREVDPTRPVTVGSNGEQAAFSGFQKTIDVMGMNYKPHQYARFKRENPDQPLHGSETASTCSTRGFYVFPVGRRRGLGFQDFQVSSYDFCGPPWFATPEQEFQAQDRNPWVAGEFVWTGFDYLGEPIPFVFHRDGMLDFESAEDKEAYQKLLEKFGGEAPSRSSYFGIVDLAGLPKDRFYLYQARWRPELPMAHILPHWTWPERLGQVTPVHVYTSGDEAELFLNGESLGRKHRGPFEYRLVWEDVRYVPGTLEVVSYKNGRPWATAARHTAGQPAQLRAAADRARIAADGEDLCFLTVTAQDAQGHDVPTATQPVTFSVDGPGEVVATCNGDPIDHTIFSSPTMPLFSGKVLGIVRFHRGAEGPMTVRMSSPGLREATLRIERRQDADGGRSPSCPRGRE